MYQQSIDLEAIRNRAMNKLGMSHANEGQTIYYAPDILDSVTRVVTVGE